MNILLLFSFIASAAADVPVNDNTCTEHGSEEQSASSIDHSAQEVEASGVVLLSKHKVLSKVVFNQDVSQSDRSEKETHTGGDGMVFSATSAFAILTTWAHRAKINLLSAIAAPSSGDGTETNKPSTSRTPFLLLVASCGTALVCLVWELQKRHRKHDIYDDEDQEEGWKNEAWVKGQRMQNERDIWQRGRLWPVDAHPAAHLAQGSLGNSFRDLDASYQDAWMRGLARPTASPASSSYTFSRPVGET